MRVLFVTTMKPLIEPFIIEQTNAIKSWKQLRIYPKIIVFGDDFGVAEFCKENNIININNISKNKQGVPHISEIIKQGYNFMDDCEYIMYINADILLMDDFSDTIESFHKNFPDTKTCLMTAVRYDIDKFKLIDYGDMNWRNVVLNEFQGKFSTPDAIDMFLHKKDNYKDMPMFAVARTMFDTWMLDYGIKNFEKSVDMSRTVKIYHHFGMWFQSNKVVSREWKNIEQVSLKENLRLLGNYNFNSIKSCKYYSDYDELGNIIFKYRGNELSCNNMFNITSKALENKIELKDENKKVLMTINLKFPKFEASIKDKKYNYSFNKKSLKEYFMTFNLIEEIPKVTINNVLLNLGPNQIELKKSCYICWENDNLSIKQKF